MNTKVTLKITVHILTRYNHTILFIQRHHSSVTIKNKELVNILISLGENYNFSSV